MMLFKFLLRIMKLINFSRHNQMLLSRAEMKIYQSLPEKTKKVLFYGKAHYCPVCESPLRGYEPFGHMDNEWCPVCSAVSRHRLAWLFLQRQTNLFDETSKKMLHIAPEAAFEPKLKKITNLDYVTGDLLNPNVMVEMDITKIPFPDSSFDVVFCSHVLEHVPNDKKALNEFFRVLTHGGWAIFMVPIRMNKLTDEDLTVINPKEREKRFGQKDHVRYYGRDFEDRLQKAGFQVTVVSAKDLVEENQFKYMGVREKNILFYCQKN